MTLTPAYNRGIDELAEELAAEATNPKELRAAADGKDPLEYLDPALEGPLSRVMRNGAAKYGRGNFRATPINCSVYIGAVRRHVRALAAGEDVDPDSGELHWAHIAACCAVVYGAMDAGTFVDDLRVAPQDTASPRLGLECANCSAPAGSTRCGRHHVLRLIVLDPGGTCGLLYGALGPHSSSVLTAATPLTALEQKLCTDLRDLRDLSAPDDEALLAYETFTLNPRRRQDHSMPSSVGLGIFRGVACAFGYPPPIGIEPGRKTAGHQWALQRLPTVAAAYTAAKNDHERDVCDLAGYLLRQHTLRKAPFS